MLKNPFLCLLICLDNKFVNFILYQNVRYGMKYVHNSSNHGQSDIVRTCLCPVLGMIVKLYDSILLQQVFHTKA